VYVYHIKLTIFRLYIYKLNCCCCSRPDAQLFEGQEEEQLNRELPNDILRRHLINNLAKHVLFSKKLTTTNPLDSLHPNYNLITYTIKGHYLPTQAVHVGHRATFGGFLCFVVSKDV